MTTRNAKELLARRKEALTQATDWSDWKIDKELSRFMRGKSGPTQTAVRRVFRDRGLL